ECVPTIKISQKGLTVKLANLEKNSVQSCFEMKILNLYIVKEFFPLFVLSFLVFTFILLLENMLELIEMSAKGGLAALKLIIYIPLFSLCYSLPMSTLTATMMGFGRLSQDNEIVAMEASGIKVTSSFIPVFFVGFLLSLLSLHLNSGVVPRARYRFESMTRELGVKKPTLLFQERVFIKDFGQYRLFIKKVKGHHLYGVHIWELREESPPLTIFAKKGEVISGKEGEALTLKLIEGMKEEVDPERAGEYRRINFDTYYFTLSLASPQEGKVNKRRNEMTIQELREEIKELKGKMVYPLLVEINRRISLAFACLTFVLIGAPLGVVVKKGGKSIGFGLSFLLILVYYIMMMLGESLGERGVLPPALTMWAPTVLLSGVGSFLIFRRIEH
ncbi:LptF/LptG family permease, partial [candidate division NPL-UPA2 bacterium]|nr:LptF/LptG family permease [candidate division NPL-UPA2 bacterium]